MSHRILGLSSWHNAVFLINSRLSPFTATLRGGHPFFRSYGTRLQSSLTRFHSFALVYSTHPPVSVYGTVSTEVHSREAFLGSMESPSCPPCGDPHHLSALLTRLRPTPPTRAAYRLERPSIRSLGYPPPSLLVKPSVLVQEYSPASHRLRISASP